MTSRYVFFKETPGGVWEIVPLGPAVETIKEGQSIIRALSVSIGCRIQMRNAHNQIVLDTKDINKTADRAAEGKPRGPLFNTNRKEA